MLSKFLNELVLLYTYIFVSSKKGITYLNNVRELSEGDFNLFPKHNYSVKQVPKP